MTDSAKQDATTAKVSSEPVADENTARVADENTARAADESGAPATPQDEIKPDVDEVKARFREALDRKRQVHAEGQGKGGHEAGKVSGAHGPAASRRSFRRKSG
jgi:hypothetical protein